MPADISSTFWRALSAQESAEIAILLLTIADPTSDTPIRLTLDSVDTISRGDTYVAYPFDLQLPGQIGDAPPTARLTIDNVSREQLTWVRQLTGPVAVTFELVLGSDPDTVEQAWEGFEIVSLTWDALTIGGDLTCEDIGVEPFPAGRYTPAVVPGAF
jgi:hypothetical protein